MKDLQPDFSSFYQSMLIGQPLNIHASKKVIRGVIIDKYLTEQNVFADILLDDGQIIERRPLFVNGQLTIELVR